MKVTVRSTLVKISAEYLFKLWLWQFMLNTDLDTFSIGKMVATAVILLNTQLLRTNIL